MSCPSDPKSILTTDPGRALFRILQAGRGQPAIDLGRGFAFSREGKFAGLADFDGRYLH